MLEKPSQEQVILTILAHVELYVSKSERCDTLASCVYGAMPQRDLCLDFRVDMIAWSIMFSQSGNIKSHGTPEW